MLIKYKDVRPKKGIKSSLQNVFMSALYQKFLSIVFSGRTILKHAENKKDSSCLEGGLGAFSPRRFSKICIL